MLSYDTSLSSTERLNIIIIIIIISIIPADGIILSLSENASNFFALVSFHYISIF